MEGKNFKQAIKAIIILAFLTCLISTQNLNEYLVKECSATSLELNCRFGQIGYQEPNPKNIPNLNFTIFKEGEDITHITVKNTDAARFEVPRDVLSEEYNNEISQKRTKTDFTQFISGQKPEVTINGINNNPIISMFKNNLHFQDDYIKFDYTIQSSKIFGYGERSGKFRLTQGKWTIWTKDPTSAGADDGSGGKGTYGFFPFLLIKHQNEYSGILFMNSNAQDLIVGPLGSTTTLSQITIGGIIEVMIWSRKTAIETIQVLHKVIGKPMLPPYWALGWHHSRWGFRNANEIKETENGYESNNLPIDTMWVDIDYMINKKDFTIDSAFNGLPSYIDELHARNRHFVPIIDIGVAVDSDYYGKGVELDTFIVSNYTKKALINQVWPGNAVFPDFMNENSYKFWGGGMQDLYDKIKFDGIWLDMNEPTGFQDGELYASYNDESNKYKQLSYIPGNDNFLHYQLSLNAQLKAGDYFNLKSVNTHYQLKLTNQFLSSLDKRPFLLTRSYLFGSNKYAAKWTGDNESSFLSMQISIQDIFTLSMAGFSLAGADICGFHLDASDSICARWHAVGAMYPFSRNHRDISNSSQEPWSFGPESKTIIAAKTFIKLKYSIIRYYYSQIFLSALHGGVVYQPVFFQFDYEELIDNKNVLEGQIMIGPGLLFCPALEIYTNSYLAMFPRANWNYFPSGKQLLTTKDFDDQHTNVINNYLSGEYNMVNLFIRGGHIIPYQDLNLISVNSTNDLPQNQISLIVNPDEFGNAFGEIIYDDATILQNKTISEGLYHHVNVSLNKGVLIVDVINEHEYFSNDIEVQYIKILNSAAKIEDVILRKKHLKFINDENWDLIKEEEHLLVVFNPPLSLKKITKLRVFK